MHLKKICKTESTRDETSDKHQIFKTAFTDMTNGKDMLRMHAVFMNSVTMIRPSQFPWWSRVL